MKKRMFAVALIITMALTGCASVPDLSDRDNSMISQYIAGAVLNSSGRYEHSFNYDKAVLNPTPKPTQTPAPAPSPESQEEPGGSGTSGTGNQGNSGSNGSSGNTGTGSSGVPVAQSVSLDNIYNIQGISVKPLSVETKKHISTSFSSISADNGNKLVIVSFAIKNNSSSAKKVNFVKKDISYSITINGKSFGSPRLTIAEGDMLSFNEKIAAGGSTKGVLVFQADESVKVKDVVVKAAKGNKESSFNVKKK